jgi:hypothetical protein
LTRILSDITLKSNSLCEGFERSVNSTALIILQECRTNKHIGYGQCI